MSVNIYDGTNLTPIAGKTVNMPYTPAPQSMIGDAWVTSHAYAVGDYCIDGNVLYKCKTAHTSSASYRPPYASYWDAVSVASQFGKCVVDENEFLTGGWTKPDFDATAVQRVSWVSGGYKQKGKLIYVYMCLSPISGSFWTNGGGGIIASGFPIPSTSYLEQVCPLKCAVWGAVGISMFVFEGNSLEKGKLFPFLSPKTDSISTNNKIYIKDVYLID